MPGIEIEDLLKRDLAMRTVMSSDTDCWTYIVDSSPTETGVREILSAERSASELRNKKVVVKVASFQVTLREGKSAVISQYGCPEDSDYLYKPYGEDGRHFLLPLGFLLEELGFDFGAFESEGLVAEAAGRSG